MKVGFVVLDGVDEHQSEGFSRRLGQGPHVGDQVAPGAEDPVPLRLVCLLLREAASIEDGGFFRAPVGRKPLGERETLSGVVPEDDLVHPAS